MELRVIQSDILYFIQNKGNLLLADSMATICTDFYTISEVEDAHTVKVSICGHQSITELKRWDG